MNLLPEENHGEDYVRRGVIPDPSFKRFDEMFSDGRLKGPGNLDDAYGPPMQVPGSLDPNPPSWSVPRQDHMRIVRRMNRVWSWVDWFCTWAVYPILAAIAYFLYSMFR